MDLGVKFTLPRGSSDASFPVREPNLSLVQSQASGVSWDQVQFSLQAKGRLSLTSFGAGRVPRAHQSVNALARERQGKQEAFAFQLSPSGAGESITFILPGSVTT